MNSNLETLHRHFLNHCSIQEGLRPRTIALMKSCMHTLRERTAARELSQLTPARLQDFFYEGRERYQWSYWHYSNHLKHLRKFFSWCMKQGHLDSNPVEGLGKPKKPKSLPRRLSLSEAQRILYASFNHPWRYTFERYRNHALIATLLYTGVRAAELLALQQLDLDLQAQTLLVRQGEGGKDRYIPIHPKLRYILQRYLKEHGRQERGTLHLFPSAQGNRALGYKGLLRCCHTLSKATGVRFTPHCLRHTFGSVAIDQRMGLVHLKNIMGHSSIQSTMVYLSLSTQGLKESVERIDLF